MHYGRKLHSPEGVQAALELQAPSAIVKAPRSVLYGLTVHQPHAWLISHRDKRIENRTWEPPAAMLKVGDYLAIHAGKTKDYGAIEELERELGIEVPGEVALGAIVCIVQYLGTYWGAPGSAPYFTGPIGWRFAEEVTRFDPVPCRGFQKLWSVTGEVLDEVRRRWTAARKGGG